MRISKVIMEKRLILAISFILIGGYAFSIDFTDKQKAVIYNEAIKTLKNYQAYNNQMADEVVDMVELNKTSQRLIDLFVSRKAIIYNDLDPSHKLSEVYELETYVANMLLWYPDGMKIFLDFDNLRAGNIMSHGSDIFTVDIMTSKRIDGNYLNQQKNSKTEELLYRIAFFQKNNAFENYRIAGVRSSKATTIADDSKVLVEVKSVNFSDKDMLLVKSQTKSLLSDYINFLNLLTDPKETNEDKAYYGISFMGLFKDSTLSVANDIEPNPKDRWIPLIDYKKNLKTAYPDGIKNLGMNLDSAEFGKVIADGNEKFYINGYIDKFFSGKYMSKTVFRDNSKYDFKVSFDRDDNTFKNFKLASVDKFGVNLYSQNAVGELPHNHITTLKRSGLYFGLSMGGGVTKLNDPNLTNNSILKWSTNGKSAINVEAKATWYIYNKFGVSMGLGYSRCSANANLTGNFQNTNYSTDVNTHQYLKNVAAAYDSILSLSYVSIPISVTYHSNSNPEKWGFYAEAGLVTSFNLNSTFQTTGSFVTTGTYNNSGIISIVTDPYFGFVNRSNINSKGKGNISGLNMSIQTSLGITYPISYFTTLFLGPEVSWSLKNISNASNFTDAFGTTSSAKHVAITKYGIKFGISYKF